MIREDKLSKKTFILSDETENCYGFIVLTSGITLDRFLKNPVMLYNHKNNDDPGDVVGKWDGTRKENSQLLAEADIDTEDDVSLKLSKKVEKGFIQCASINLDFLLADVTTNHPQYPGVPVITKCELKEASLVAIPGNKNAVRLFADGKVIENDTLALSLKHDNTNQDNITSMKKIMLFAAALGVSFSESTTEDHVLEAVKTLAGDRDALKLRVKELEDKIKKTNEDEIKAFLDESQDAKLFDAAERPHFEKLALADLPSTKEIVKKLKPHKTLSSQLGGKDGSEKKSPFEGKTFKELQKDANGSKYLAKLRVGTAEDRAEFKRLWEEAYPNGNFNG